MGGVAVTRCPHVEVTRVRDFGSHRYHHSFVVARDDGTIRSGLLEGTTFDEAWRKVRRMVRRPHRYAWRTMTDDERRRYGLIVPVAVPPEGLR